MTRLNKLLRALLLIAAAVSLTAPVQADDHGEILRQALARSDAGVTYAYDVLYERPDLQSYFQVDPSRAKGERVTVSSPERASWDAEFAIMLNDMDEDAKTQFWCSDFAENIPATARVVSETDTTVTYAYEPIPEDDDDEMIFPHLTGRVTVSRHDPAILAIRMYAPDPFSPILLGRFEHFDFEVDCERLPDGRTHVQRFSHLIKGKIATEAIHETAVWQVLQYHEVAN